MIGRSLVDWEMRSDRNDFGMRRAAGGSLVDWEMRSDRNGAITVEEIRPSLVDWEMRSDRNGPLERYRGAAEFSRLGNAL